MLYTFDRFHNEIKQALLNTGLIYSDEIELQISKAASVQADLALPCFRAARKRGTDPTHFAAQLAVAARASVQPKSLIHTVEATGSFVNFSLNVPAFARHALAEAEERADRYGWDDLGAGCTVVIDYSSPNIAKRMHAGHIRSTIIGQALANIYRAQGYTVVGDNHLGDWGKQFGVLLAAINRRGFPQGEGEEALARLEQLYAEYAGQMENDPALDAEARNWSLRLEQGDSTAREIWQRSVDLTQQINQRNYDRLGVRFDTEQGESFYADMSQSVIDDAVASGITHRDESGALVIDLNGLPTFLLQRSDGGTLYHTRDLATIRYREQTYHPAKIIYVVGKPQELHFKQLFAAARAMGYVRPDVELIHVMFGTVFGPDGQPLSTRKGNRVYLEALLDEATQRAQTIVDQKAAERGSDLSPDEREHIAAAIGIGSVIYNDLYQAPSRNINFDWDRMLSLDGNSATYLQYIHTRCRSILRRAGDIPQEYDATLLQHPSETALPRDLGQFPMRVREAADQCAPYLIADWLYGAARQFSAFYRDCPVLEAPSPELRAARLHLVGAIVRCLKNGLALLGIRAPERM